eukprot:m.187947 g.187947  ORF g.187947 m.187947 type:complete len:179 (-) comp14786_c0_seq1:70-606(-)
MSTAQVTRFQSQQQEQQQQQQSAMQLQCPQAQVNSSERSEVKHHQKLQQRQQLQRQQHIAMLQRQQQHQQQPVCQPPDSPVISIGPAVASMKRHTQCGTQVSFNSTRSCSVLQPTTRAKLILVTHQKCEAIRNKNQACSTSSPLLRTLHTARMWEDLKRATQSAPDRLKWVSQALELL